MAVNFQPSNYQSRVRAISLISGEVIRNVVVMPTGMPDRVNPMKSGTLEQEQKG